MTGIQRFKIHQSAPAPHKLLIACTHVSIFFKWFNPQWPSTDQTETAG